MKTEQYAVVKVNLDPTIGSEIKKTRPCVIVSPNEMNENLSTVIIVPLTSQPKKYPTRVPVVARGKKSMCALDQIRTIDKRRIVGKSAIISQKEIAALKRVLKEMLVD